MRRLLPALATVVIATSILATWFLPAPQNLTQSKAAIWAVLWISNIYFAFTGRDYFGDEANGNAFLHTWSLGVEEQFYLAWPLLIFAVLKFSNGKDISSLIRAFAVVLTISLVACIWLSITQPTIAFYLMPTRAWQFAAGGIIWLLAQRYDLAILSVFAWIGVLLIMFALTIISGSTVYPGAWALVPTVASCALLWAGSSTTRSTANSYPMLCLSSRPMQFIGNLSYSWYLWHWPLLVIAGGVLLDKHHLGSRLLALLLSLLLAFATHKCIENPIRYGRVAVIKPLWQIGAALLVMALLSYQLLGWKSDTQELVVREMDIYIKAARDLPIIYPQGCDDWYNSAEVKPCIYGNPNAEKTAVLLGDSIGAQWFPAFGAMLDSQQWQLITLTKSSCPMVDEAFFYARIKRDFTECTTWRNQVLAQLQSIHTDRLFIGGTASPEFTDEQWVQGTQRVLSKLVDNTDGIYIIEANPPLPFNGLDCLAKYHGDAKRQAQCSGKQSEQTQYIRVAGLLRKVAHSHPKIHWLDTSSFVCPNGICQALRDGMIVYRDSQHLTATFTTTAAQHFLQQIESYERAR